MVSHTHDERRSGPTDHKSQPFQYIGRGLRRNDSAGKLTGHTRFVSDLGLSGLLHARLVLSPYAHARIHAIDRTHAEQVPNVVRVLVADDLKLAQAGSGLRKRDPLARDVTLYHGHPVAVVVATSPEAAEDAAALVDVEYETLEEVIDPAEAGSPNARPVRQQGAADDEEASMHGAVGGQETIEHSSPNISSSVRFAVGDVGAGFDTADVVIERSYSTPWVHQAYLEPQSAVAQWDGEHVTVWASTQALFFTRSEVAATVGIKESNVTVVPMPVGGGFGGKFVLIEPLTAAIAREVGAPVEVTFARMDEFVTANPAPASKIYIKLGATHDGQLSAMTARLEFDTGSSSSSAARIAPTIIGSQYRITNIEIEAIEVLTHKTGGGSYRAPGAVQAHFAVESAVDEIARGIGMDPLELRTLNAAREGDPRPSGGTWPRIGLADCLASVGELDLWRRRNEVGGGVRDEHSRRLGVGMAVGGWPGGIEPATAVCRVDADGTFTIVVGAIDISGTHTGFQVIAAEAIGVHPDSVRVVISDSDSAPQSGATGGSKITYTVGAAVQKAAEDARNQILQAAADYLEVAAEDLELEDGVLRVTGVPDRQMSLSDVVRDIYATGKYPRVLGNGASTIDRNAPGFGVHLAHVAVDTDTGDVEVLDYAVVQDVGVALNPPELEGQIHGGVTQGLGWALWEQIVYSPIGQVVTGSLMDYAVPKSGRVPNINITLLEVPSELGPFGAKGVGEPPVIPVAAAVANAIHDATGIRLTDLPMTSERVIQAIWNSKATVSEA